MSGNEQSHQKSSVEISKAEAKVSQEALHQKLPKYGQVHYPNPPEITNPDVATLRDQWRYAIRQYSRWYSHAWGTAIFAGLSFFALGWFIKGSNPLPSKQKEETGEGKQEIVQRKPTNS